MTIEVRCNSQKQLQSCVDTFDKFKRQYNDLERPPCAYYPVQDSDDHVNVVCCSGGKFILVYKEVITAYENPTKSKEIG